MDLALETLEWGISTIGSTDLDNNDRLSEGIDSARSWDYSVQLVVEVHEEQDINIILYFHPIKLNFSVIKNTEYREIQLSKGQTGKVLEVNFPTLKIHQQL